MGHGDGGRSAVGQSGAGRGVAGWGRVRERVWGWVLSDTRFDADGVPRFDADGSIRLDNVVKWLTQGSLGGVDTPESTQSALRFQVLRHPGLRTAHYPEFKPKLR